MPESARIRRILGRRPVLRRRAGPLPHRDRRSSPTSCCRPRAGARRPGRFTNVNRTVHLSEKAVEPPGEARSDLDIFLIYADAMGFTDQRRRAADRRGARPRRRSTPGRRSPPAARSTTPACPTTSCAAPAASRGRSTPSTRTAPTGSTPTASSPPTPTTARPTATTCSPAAPVTEPEHRAMAPGRPGVPQGRRLHTGRTRSPATSTRCCSPPAAPSTSSTPAPRPAARDAEPGRARRLGRAVARRRRRARHRRGRLVRVESPRGAIEVRARVGQVMPGAVFAPFHYGILGPRRPRPTPTTAAGQRADDDRVGPGLQAALLQDRRLPGDPAARRRRAPRRLPPPRPPLLPPARPPPRPPPAAVLPRRATCSTRPRTTPSTLPRRTDAAPRDLRRLSPTTARRPWPSRSAPSPTVTPGRPTSSTPATPWPAGASSTATPSPRSSSATAKDDVDEPERLHADGLTSTREGEIGLLRDLQDLHLLATLVQTHLDRDRPGRPRTARPRTARDRHLQHRRDHPTAHLADHPDEAGRTSSPDRRAMTRRSTSDLVRPTPHVLRQYALIADGERGALVGPRGDIAFLCAPALARRRGVLQPARRARRLRRQPRRRPVRLGRLLRAGQPDLAQPLGLHRRRDRVPRGPRVPRRARTGRAAPPHRGHPQRGARPGRPGRAAPSSAPAR